MLRNCVTRKLLFESKEVWPDMIWGDPLRASERLIQPKCFRILRELGAEIGGSAVLVVRPQVKAKPPAQHFTIKLHHVRPNYAGRPAATGPVGVRPIEVRVSAVFEGSSDVEIPDAINCRANGRAPWPAGLLFAFCWLINCVLTGGSSPRSLAELYVALLGRPNRDAQFSGSKRPKLLMSAAAKLFEAAVIRRLSPPLGRTLEGNQYAHHMCRGAEFHLAQSHDSVRTKLADGRHGNLAAVYINGAYDNGDLLVYWS